MCPVRQTLPSPLAVSRASVTDVVGTCQKPSGSIKPLGSARHSGGDVDQQGIRPVVVLRGQYHEQGQGRARGVAHAEQVFQDLVAGSTISDPPCVASGPGRTRGFW